MHIYDKQCGIMQKNQWKGPNFQIQCFYNGTSGALCWKRQKTPKLEKLKRKLLNFLKMYDLYRVVPWESQRPGNSENVVVFEFWRFQTIVIGRQSWVKIEEKILRRGTVKKRHGHNFEFWAPKLNQRGTNMVVSTLIQFQAVILKIVAVSFFLNTS